MSETIPKKLDILIPTYKRSEYLKENLDFLASEIRSNGLSQRVAILVSDNHSPDDTWLMLTRWKEENADIDVRLWRQDSNISLEPNAVFVLDQSSAEFVMYCGDDDLVSVGYLARLLQLIDNEPDFSVCISGIESTDVNGNAQHFRASSRDEYEFVGGPETCRRLSHLGHQMSGLTFRRRDTLDRYLAHPELRNIYPFIFFVANACMQGRCFFLPGFRTRVFLNPDCDWSYDDNGLLYQCLKNYRILCRDSWLQQALQEVAFCRHQRWRLGVSGRASTESPVYSPTLLTRLAILFIRRWDHLRKRPWTQRPLERKPARQAASGLQKAA